MNGLRYVEAAVAALVALWLAAGPLAHPVAFGALALLALLLLAVVVLPLLVSFGFAERPVTVRRSGRPAPLRGYETADGSVRVPVRSRRHEDERPRPAD